MDAKGIITRSEGKGLAALGLEAGELVGKSVFDLYRTPRAIETNRRALAGEEVHTLSRLGKTSLENRYSPVFDSRGRVTGVIGVTVDVTERVDMEERVRKLLLRLLAVQDDERRRIAREIHADAGQTLTALKLNLDLARRERDRSKMTARLAEASGFAAKVLDELRRIASDLQPGALEQLGLKPSLRALCQAFRKRTGIECAMMVDLAEGAPLDAESTIFRFVQEALNNVASHARARTVTLRVVRKGSGTLASIEDDGIGFDTRRALDGEGLGLLGIRERARTLGGELEIESRPGHGTRLLLSFPVGAADAS